ncbi:MAG: hypothetical protein KBS55_00685 [Bacteroidales bacterium]|nr:hypothetical protein [Candidatus Cryptobacteroides aphodequi]
MKRYIKLFVCAAAAVLAFASCSRDYEGYYDNAYYEKTKNFLTLRNYSSDATVWYIPDVDHADVLPTELTEWQKIAIYSVDAHSSGSLTFDSSDNYETPVETYGVDDELVIYVFKKDVWNSHSWSELVAGQMWCGKCTLSVEDALKSNGIVTYPMR